MSRKLIIIRGAPGSGKSSFYNSMFGSIFHIENDMFHYHGGKYTFNQRKQDQAIQWCIDSCLFAMNRGMDIVISNTFTKIRYIQSYINYAEIMGYDVEIYRMMGKFNNIHGLDEKMVENFEKTMEDYPNEIFVYPNGKNEDGSFRYETTTIRVGDIVFDQYKENGSKRGLVDSIGIDSNGVLRVFYHTEKDLFSDIEYCSSTPDKLQIWSTKTIKCHEL